MASASTPTPGTDANAQLARRYPEDIATQGNIDLVDEICTDDVVDHSPLGELRGRDELKGQISMLREAFGDFSATVEDVVTEGDVVAMRVTLRGMHRGEFMGHEATGNTFEVGNMVFTRIEDGLIAERWVQPDMLGMLTQLGIVELPEM
ncbi:ester cyclase [Haloferax sp. MBLA0076]|uniref:Ester cyclase n=1 Tax=Haloferax litoreum TaxID=2666140 RepID=A0A6A8GCE5_9EURY|nr:MULTISPECIES: ester cyclase [Haloferax]KAB1192336.1 ester cyclase [Haloferax sp. CBA1148]MRX20798.1 ester cyclase [Haloferax litoreum]